MIRSRRSIFEVHADARRNPFGSLKKECSVPVERQMQATKNARVERALATFEEILKTEDRLPKDEFLHTEVDFLAYLRGVVRANNLAFSNRDFTEFLVATSAPFSRSRIHEDTKGQILALFLTALFENSSERPVHLDLNISSIEPTGIGILNNSDLVVSASYVYTLGRGMRGGMLEYTGNTGSIGEYLFGGTIVYKGELTADMEIGVSSLGGTIILPLQTRSEIKAFFINIGKGPNAESVVSNGVLSIGAQIIAKDGEVNLWEVFQ